MRKNYMNETETALASALSQTGFPFEHHIFEEVRRNGWSTLPNRLYIDAEEGKTREMDLLCYRAETTEQEVGVYTGVLISCKARADKPWIMMTRPWPAQRPPWYPYPPVPVWSNSAPIRYECHQPSWGVEYFDLASDAGLKRWSEDSREEVFALQEFEAARDGGGKKHKPLRYKSLNDTSLYMGSMSLLKALAYELEAVEARRATQGEKFVYQFNLIQMLDGDLYEASFSTPSPIVRPVDRYRYFARTMLAGKEHSARIDFCTRAGLPALLQDLAKVHRFNFTHFNQLEQRFYDGLTTSQQRLNALLPALETKLRYFIPLFFSSATKVEPGFAQISYKKENKLMKVELCCGVPGEKMRNDKPFVGFVEKCVRDIYKYSGDIYVDEDDIPF
jgi:hypothetical protein